MSAIGRIDGYWERELNPWDIAAGDLHRARGGGSSQPPGHNPGHGEPVARGEIVAANPALFEGLNAVVGAG